MRTPGVSRRCGGCGPPTANAKGITMVVKSSRSAPLISASSTSLGHHQGRSKEEPLRVTVHYRNLAGASMGGASYGRDGSVLASSASAARWGSSSGHNGQVTGSLISDAGRPAGPGARRVRFDLPSSGSDASEGPTAAGAGVGAPHHAAHHSTHHSAHHAAHHSERGAPTVPNGGGWSPWSARQSASARQPAQQAQQQPQRSPWSGGGSSHSAGPGPPARPSAATLAHHGQDHHGHHGHHGNHGYHGGNTSAAVLVAARDGDHHALLEVLRRNPPPSTLNHRDAQGRTPASHLAALGGAGGGAGLLELLLQCPGVDVNQPDSEGNTPLHFAAQAGQLEAVGALLRQPDIQVDARNAQGFTPLMKAALQGRTKCARALLLAGASPTMRDTGRGLRAEQWARFCGRHVCAELIERLARQRLLDRGTAYGRWGSEPELQAALGRVQQARSGTITTTTAPRSIKSRVRRAFRSSAATDLPAAAPPASSSPAFSLITQLTGAGLCASTPALPVPSMPPVVKSLLRPLSVPRLQVTLARAS